MLSFTTATGDPAAQLPGAHPCCALAPITQSTTPPMELKESLRK